PVPAYSRLRIHRKRPEVLEVDLKSSESMRRPTASVYRASQGGRACLERAGRSQPADGRLRYVEAPCHVSLRFAIRKPLNRFLPLVGRPKRTPRACARLLPSSVRARISSRANSA